MNSFGKDLFKYVSKFISFVDVMSLRWTCKQFHAMPMPVFKDRIADRLSEILGCKCDEVPNKEEEFFENWKIIQRVYRDNIRDRNFVDNLYKDMHSIVLDMKNMRRYFLYWLKQSGAIIAGSFILDCLYDTNYHNDIDLYDKMLLTNFRGCFKYGEEPLDDKGMQFSQYLWIAGFRDGVNCSTTNGLIRKYNSVELSRGEAKKDKNCIQVIPMSIPIEKCISATFDLDICKSRFNGEKLLVKSWNKLVHRYDQIKINARFVMASYYLKNNNHHYIRGPFTEESTKERHDKYIQRGFNIILHPKAPQIEKYIHSCINDKRDIDGLKLIEQGKFNLELFEAE